MNRRTLEKRNSSTSVRRLCVESLEKRLPFAVMGTTPILDAQGVHYEEWLDFLVADTALGAVDPAEPLQIGSPRISWLDEQNDLIEIAELPELDPTSIFSMVSKPAQEIWGEAESEFYDIEIGQAIFTDLDDLLTQSPVTYLDFDSNDLFLVENQIIAETALFNIWQSVISDYALSVYPTVDQNFDSVWSMELASVEPILLIAQPFDSSDFGGPSLSFPSVLSNATIERVDQALLNSSLLGKSEFHVQRTFMIQEEVWRIGKELINTPSTNTVVVPFDAANFRETLMFRVSLLSGDQVKQKVPLVRSTSSSYYSNSSRFKLVESSPENIGLLIPSGMLAIGNEPLHLGAFAHVHTTPKTPAFGMSELFICLDPQVTPLQSDYVAIEENELEMPTETEATTAAPTLGWAATGLLIVATRERLFQVSGKILASLFAKFGRSRKQQN